MKIALYGGSFNPFHLAHQMSILYVLETREDIGMVWVAPCFRHNFGKELVSFEHRMRMCRLGTRVFDSDRVVVSPIDRDSGGCGKTWWSVTKLQNEGAHVSLVVGSDIIPEIPLWYKGQEILSTIPLIHLPRGGYAPTQIGGFTLPEISSTAVRKTIADSQDIRGMVPTKVAHYISENKLYLSKESEGGSHE